MSVQVSRVESAADRDAFIKFQWQIYRDDPAWVPPLIIERKAFLNRRKHPFYKHGDAALFLARQDGEIVGRLMASDDPNYNLLHQTSTGCFGLFESVDDPDVAAALFGAAEEWLRVRGRTEIMGPIDYSTNYVCGLLIDGFEHPPTILTAHNPPYYARLIDHYGFAKEKDWYAWWFSEFPAPAARLRKIAQARARKEKVTIRPIDLKQIAAEGQRIRDVYNQAWEKNWGFVPFTEAEIEHMTEELKPLIVPQTALIAEIDGDPIGFVLGVPDINVALRKINGRLTTFGLPIGLLKLLYHLKKARTGRLIALGVVKDYRRAGVAEMLVLRLMDEAFRLGFTGELSMTLEDNVMVNRFIEAMGAKRYKTYRIYRRSIAA
jgi:GNAT superfamily N-acetyltransferase